jgi:hypothetical protein
MICQKEFTLAVTEMQFAWPAATLDDGITGLATFTPQNANGNTAVADADTLGTVTTCNSDNEGVMIWNSNDPVPVNMNVTVQSVGSGTMPDPNLFSILHVYVLAPLTTLLLVQVGIDIGWNNTADFPFMLPDTGGADWELHWFHRTLVESNPANPGSVRLTGILTFL